MVSAASNDLPPLEAAYHFFTFPAAAFTSPKPKPTPHAPPITITNEFLIIEGIRRADEWEKLRDRVPSLDLILGLVADPVAGNRDINLKPDEWRVLTMINGRDTIRQIAQRTGFGDFKTARIVYHLLSAGLIEPLRRRPPPPPPRRARLGGPGAARHAARGAPPRPMAAPRGRRPPTIRPAASAPGARPAGPRPGARPARRRRRQLYARLEAIATGELARHGRLLLSDAYKRLRVQPGLRSRRRHRGQPVRPVRARRRHAGRLRPGAHHFRNAAPRRCRVLQWLG